MNSLPRRQQGMALVITLIMLLLMTLMVSSSFTLSTTNLEGVGSQQWRSEALAAADTAIEQVIGSSFTTAPAAQSISVDMNQNGSADYVVQVSQPVCVRARVASVAPPSSMGLQGMSNNTWNTIWEIVAAVQDPVSGASVRVRSGVRVLLSESVKNAICP
ncbi:PilX N-terminal domain-containing pilus assembly protein [Pseudomonas sp. CAU 1711]|uniref:PilX N-terminal domain-containing pilus assembly protein n=1 Tax=Pseudomonas sp. CAU 1711 TaxID=3140356 RepID=UPI003261850D